jgi:hypothetical protein
MNKNKNEKNSSILKYIFHVMILKEIINSSFVNIMEVFL